MKDVIPPLDEGEIYKIFREVVKTANWSEFMRKTST
jgi:hypothetical protein